jgi:chromosome partitioning protein
MCAAAPIMVSAGDAINARAPPSRCRGRLARPGSPACRARRSGWVATARSLSSSRRRLIPMKTLVLCNQKGGVGKSAVATLLAHYLVQRRRRVLAIDLDHQGNLGKPLRRSGRAAPTSFGADALLTGPAPALPNQPFVVVPGDRALLGLERQPERHTPFARQWRAFLAQVDSAFDVCVIDTNPNPDIRVIAALVSCDYVLSPIQLNQEAMDGVSGLLNHERVGLRKIRAVLNPKLSLIGLLPTMVECTPFQKANFLQVVQQYHPLMIRIGDGPGAFASMPRRSCIAEAQAEGAVLWEMKKTAARDAWREIEPGLARIADIVDGPGTTAPTVTATSPEAHHAAAA